MIPPAPDLRRPPPPGAWRLQVWRLRSWPALLACLALLGCDAGSREEAAPENRLTFGSALIGRGFPMTGTGTTFTFTMPGPYRWTDYRDDELLTPAGEKVRISVWLAGRQDDLDIIGFSVLGAVGGLMNTLCLVPHEGPFSSEIIAGFILQRGQRGR